MINSTIDLLMELRVSSETPIFRL